MRRFSFGDKIIKLSSLEFCDSILYYHMATRVETVTTANDEYFSPSWVDLKSAEEGVGHGRKCHQSSGRASGIGNDRYFNLTTNPDEVREIIESMIAEALKEDRILSDQMIRAPEKQGRGSSPEAETLKKESHQELALLGIKRLVLEGLGLS